MKKNNARNVLLVCLVFLVSCSKDEIPELTKKVPVKFSFSGLVVEEGGLRSAMSETAAPQNLHYVITEATSGKIALEGDCQRSQGLNLELFPGNYNCRFVCSETYKNPLLITDLSSQHFYHTDYALNVLETGTEVTVVLKRMVSAIEIIKSDGLKLFPWITIKASVSSPTSLDLTTWNFSSSKKWTAVTGDNNFNFVFPAENVKIEVTLHSNLSNQDYDRYSRTVNIQPNRRYKVITKLLGGNSDGSDLGGAKITFDVIEEWDGETVL
ncbi:MAG: hypothetical protein ACOX6C_00235 [Patescibacteria group bacterium]|jgi:hypothetical protein